MKDTRETIIKLGDYEEIPVDNELRQDIASDKRPKPRFKRGDRLISADAPYMFFELKDNPFWLREFGGWVMIVPGCIGVHESNFILASEKDLWESHENGLWSWWTRK